MEVIKMFIGLLILLGVGAYFLFFSKNAPKAQFSNKKSAEETLKDRYVNGGIDEETYLRMKETLNK
jgi:uncharacterized membrane protein